MRRRGEPIAAKPERPPSAPSGITPPPLPPPQWSSGTIREACSCGASVSVPATADGREYIGDWRHMHRHDVPRSELKTLGRPVHSAESTVTTGEIRESETQDVPFGFFPPVVEARQS